MAKKKRLEDSKFKKGDKVKIVKSIGNLSPKIIGHETKIHGVALSTSNNYFYLVTVPSAIEKNEEDGGVSQTLVEVYAHEDSLELVKE